MSRLRDVARSLYDRLVFVPLVFVIVGLVSGFAVVRLDKWTSDDWLPTPLRSTVESADSILSTIAGGLISAITLLLSITLVAVQLASSQFSPRTINDWIRDRTQQITIGFVLGTTVFCLMVLRETQSLDGSVSVSPDVSVLMAVALMVVCLVMVVRSVGHLSHRMQIGTVARTLMEDTVTAIRSRQHDSDRGIPSPQRPSRGTASFADPDDGWTAAIAHSSGWLNEVNWAELAVLAAESSSIRMAVPVGSFVLRGQAMAWIEEPLSRTTHADDARPDIEISRKVAAIGPDRLIAHDPSFGILQMSDVALRALSPGINDPNTACDIISYMGVVTLVVWEHAPASSERDQDGRRIISVEMTHEQYLKAAFEQIVRYGIEDPVVVRKVAAMLDALLHEVRRRRLPGPVEPLEDMREWVSSCVSSTNYLPGDSEALRMPAT